MHTLKNGISMQLNAYQNYSDNDYKVKVKEYLDVNTGNYIKDKSRWFKRFHDRYHNEAVIAKIGVVNKPWADRLMLGIRYMQENMQIQNANIMTIVYGGKKQETKNWSPSIEYEKKDLFLKNLNISLSGRYDIATVNNIDTPAREYSWTGKYRTRTSQDEADKTIAKQKDKSGYITSNINYNLDNKHFISLNNIFSDFRREDKSAVSNQKTNRKSQKDAVGLSYKYAPSEKWNALAFVKYYYTHVIGPVDTTKNSSGRYENRTNNYSLTGYGAAATYNLLKSIQLKTSFEKTYRLPTPKELFGNGNLEQGNASINPENSKNINFNISLNQSFLRNHTITVDAGFIYRDIKNFIKREINNKGFGRSLNLKKIISIGGEFEARYFYKNKLSVGGNLTYQNIRNKEKPSPNSSKLNIYNDRVPNIPYLFGNADANYNLFNILGKGNTMSIGYNLHHIHKFYKDWQNENGDISVPKQFSHDINLTYTLKDGMFNFALEAKNITDELLYDNFYLQKPGRSFTIKFRYFFFKRNNIK